MTTYTVDEVRTILTNILRIVEDVQDDVKVEIANALRDGKTEQAAYWSAVYTGMNGVLTPMNLTASVLDSEALDEFRDYPGE